MKIAFKMMALICLLTLTTFGVCAQKIYYPGEGYLLPTPKSQQKYTQALPTLSDMRLITANGRTIVVETVSDQFPYITLSAQVFDEIGNPVLDLTENDFSVSEIVSPDTVPVVAPVSCFSESLSVSGISFALVVDISGSMGGKRLADAKLAVSHFINRSSADDQGALVSFSSGGTEKIVVPLNWVGTDSDNNGTRDLIDAVNGLVPWMATAVFDATAKGMDSLASASNPKVVILFSDGESNDDKLYSIDQVIQRANQEHVVLYTIGLGIDSQNLATMASQTGGKYYFAPTAADMVAVYSDIYDHFARLVKKEYHVTYKTHSTQADGSLHTYTLSYSGSEINGSYTANYAPQISLDTASQNLMDQSQTDNAPLTVSGVIEDINADALGQNISATLYYKNVTQTVYSDQALALIQTGPGQFSFNAQIPGSSVTGPGIEFYIQATDGVSDAFLPVNHTQFPFVIPVMPDTRPQITHTPVTSAVSGQNIPITCTVSVIEPGHSIPQVLLYYRLVEPYRYTEYFPVTMVTTDQVTYAADIPASQITQSGIEYFISAKDSSGIRHDNGSDTMPYTIVIDGMDNRSPVADAGIDQSVTEGAIVTLDGSATYDPDSTDTLSYQWEQIQGPAFTLSDDTAQNPSFSAPVNISAPVTAVFQLVVTDSKCLHSSDNVYITINDSAPLAGFSFLPVTPAKNVPIVFTDQSVTGLDQIVSWQWDFAGLGQSTSPNPEFTFTSQGSYSVTLTVTDSDGSTAVITQTINVGSNVPVVDAGQDRNVTEGHPVILDGSGSYDTDPGDVLTYSWTQLSGPVVDLADPTAVSQTFDAPLIDNSTQPMVFQLTVTDSDGLQSSASVTITVLNSSCGGDCDANAGCFISDLFGVPKSTWQKTDDKGWFLFALWGCSVWFLLGLKNSEQAVKGAGFKIKFWLIVFCMILGYTTAGHAKIKPKSFSVTPFIGGYMFDDEQNIDVSPLVGIGLQYHLDSNWGIELTGKMGQSEYHFACPNCDCDQTDVAGSWVDLNAVYHLQPDKRLVPYVAAGLGYGWLNYDRFDDYSSVFINYGGGLEYFVKPNISLRSDVRHIYNLEDAYHNLSLWVGISFSFGGKPDKVEKPLVVPLPELAQVQNQGLVPPSGPVPALPVIKKPSVSKLEPINLYIKFDLNKAAILPGFYPELDQVADFLKENKGLDAIIEGHTCNLGSESYNLELSAKRALAVKQYLITKGGIDSARITIHAFGESKPIADNSTKPGRQKNRRATIRYILNSYTPNN